MVEAPEEDCRATVGCTPGHFERTTRNATLQQAGNLSTWPIGDAQFCKPANFHSWHFFIQSLLIPGKTPMSNRQMHQDAQQNWVRLLNQLLENAEEMPYSFHLEETEITSNLADSFGKLAGQSTEPGRWCVCMSAVCAWR